MISFSKTAASALLIAVAVPSRAHADDFWATKPNRIKIANALNGWADHCSGMFGFDRRPKLSNETLEPKVDAYLLLSATPSLEVERWAGWLPYADPNADVAKPSTDRAADALLAARADPSSALAAEKLYIDTRRSFFHEIYTKCQEGSRNPLIGQYFYRGEGDFEKAMLSVHTDFAEAVADLDKPDPPKAKPKPRARRK